MSRGRPGGQPSIGFRRSGVRGPGQALGQGLQHGDELGRVQHLEVEALEREVQGELVQGIGSRVQDAAAGIDGLQPARGRGRPPGDVLRRPRR
jgi:hypothetical protein